MSVKATKPPEPAHSSVRFTEFIAHHSLMPCCGPRRHGQPVGTGKESTSLDDLIPCAAATTNYLDPDKNDRLYQDCGTVIVVSGLLTTATYAALFTGFMGGATGGKDAQFVWFCVLNNWSFCLSVVAIFTAVAGIGLLQRLETWPKDWADLPLMPAVKINLSDDLGLVETYGRALNFVWHANRYGVLRPEVSKLITRMVHGIWLLLLVAMVLALGAGCVALEKHVGRDSAGSTTSPAVFWGPVFAAVVLTLAVSFTLLWLAIVYGDNAMVAGSVWGTARYRVHSNGEEWDKAVRRSVSEGLVHSKADLIKNMWITASALARNHHSSQDEGRIKLIVQKNAAAVLAHLEYMYTDNVTPIMTILNQWKDTYGEYFILRIRLDPGLGEVALKYTQELWTFWRKVERMLDQGVLTPDEFFTNNWLGRAVEYRKLGEQLDIGNFYAKNKHIEYGNHYVDGLEPDEYVRGADGALVDVKDSRARPGRYRLIQQQELQRHPGVRPADTLKLARLLKALGTGDGAVRFEDTGDWTADLKAALGSTHRAQVPPAASTPAVASTAALAGPSVGPATLARPSRS